MAPHELGRRGPRGQLEHQLSQPVRAQPIEVTPDEPGAGERLREVGDRAPAHVRIGGVLPEPLGVLVLLLRDVLGKDGVLCDAVFELSRRLRERVWI